MAQDVEEAIKETGFTGFDAVYKPTNPTDNYSLSYGEFVVPLVKAVQELNQRNNEQQLLIDKLQKQNDELLKRIEALEKK